MGDSNERFLQSVRPRHPDPQPGHHVEIIGHRGYSARAPENTLVSLRLALERGADAVEWDVHVAACGTPVLIHDAQLGRTTNGFGPVRRRSMDQLRKLDAGGWFDPAFAGEGIPTLAEALEEVRPFGATAYVEVKGYRELEDLDRMARITRDLGMSHQVAFISLDFGIVDRLAGQDPEARMGYVVDRHQAFQEALGRARKLKGRSLVDLAHTLVLEDPFLVPRARAQGVDVAVWTVNDVDEARALADAGVRRFTTDEVERLVAWRAGTGAPPTPPAG